MKIKKTYLAIIILIASLFIANISYANENCYAFNKNNTIGSDGLYPNDSLGDLLYLYNYGYDENGNKIDGKDEDIGRCRSSIMLTASPDIDLTPQDAGTAKINFNYTGNSEAVPFLLTGTKEVDGSSIDDLITVNAIAPDGTSLFNIAGSKNVTIQHLVIQGEYDNVVSCTNGKNITIQNLEVYNPKTAIKFVGCDYVTLNSLYIYGANTTGSVVEEVPEETEEGEGEEGDEEDTTPPEDTVLTGVESAIIDISGTSIDSKLSEVTLNNIYFYDAPVGTAVRIKYANNVTLNNIQAPGGLTGTLVELESVEDLVVLNVTGNGVDNGISLIDVKGDTPETMVMDLSGNKNALEGVGLYLEGSEDLVFNGGNQDLINIYDFKDSGIVVSSDSQRNTFQHVKSYDNNEYGLVFEGTVNTQNEVADSDFYDNGDCGIYFGTGPLTNKLSGTNEVWNNGNDCVIGGTAEMDFADENILVIPVSKEEIYVDVVQSALGIDDQKIEIHYKKIAFSTEATGEGSHIAEYEIADLPLPADVDTTSIPFTVIVKNSTNWVTKIWQGELYTEGNVVSDQDGTVTNCYSPEDSSEKYRIYVYGADSDGDLLTDEEEDPNFNCLVDEGETNADWWDTDDDNISDKIEKDFASLGYDPLNDDVDGDGLKDGEEDLNADGDWDKADYTLDPFGETNPFDAHSDNDGVTDFDERAYSTNPNVDDTDGDGLNDGDDDCPTFPNECYYSNCIEGVIPEIEIDNDGDLVMDYYEDANQNCMFDAGEMRPDKADTDGDGIADGWEDKNKNGLYEPDLEETDPTDEDTDDDCLIDGVEDKNGDGEILLSSGETDPTLVDSDGDTLADGEEDYNCDGINDAGETMAYLADTDGDGEPDNTDIGPWTPYPTDLRYYNINGFDSYDADGDGLPDIDEDFNGDGVHTVSNKEPSALLYDTDMDGLNDAEEVLCYHTNPNAVDTDSDGRTDFEEVEWSATNFVCDFSPAKNETDPTVYNDGCSLNTNNETTNGTNLPILIMFAMVGFVIVNRRRKESL